MAQAKTIQLLRSSSVYASLEAAKTALQTQDFITARSDGELVLARYNHTDGNKTTIKSVIGVYHRAPNLPEGSAAGVTFIEDVTSAAGSAAALQAEIDRIETAVGLGETGTKSDFTGAAVTDGVIAASDDLIAAIQKVANAIAGMDKAANAVNGQVVTTVAQANGSVTETKANVKDLQLGGYSKDTSATGAIGSTDTVNTALSKLENTIAANDTARTVASSDQSITVTNSASGTNVIVNVDGTTIVKDGTYGALKSGLKVIKVIPSGTADTDEVVDATLPTNVKEAYRLVYNGSTTAIGQQVNVYKESALDRVYMGHVDDTVNSSTGAVTSGTGDDAMCFVYHQADGTYTLVSVNVESFLQETEFGDGLQVANHVVTVKTGDGLEYGSESGTNKSVKVKIDTTSTGAENFLSVSSNGVKISGVQNAIDTAINALDVTDTAVAGQYVSAVNETDGKVSMTRANVADAVLTGYSKGNAPASGSEAVAATDDVKGAIAKLEHQVDAAVSAASTAVSGLDGTADATSVTSGNVPTADFQVLTKVVETDGVVQAVGATNGSTSATLKKLAATGAAADVSVAADATSGLAAGNVQDTLEALTTATSNGLDSVSSGNAAIAVGTKTNKDQSVSLVLDASTGANITTGTVTDMLTITNNGLAMNDTWDCGTF